MKQTLLLFAASLLLGYNATAQQITPAIINSSGGGGTIGGASFDYSIAEMTVVSTATAAGNSYTQGLLQPPKASGESINEIIFANATLNIFPNPNSNILFIESKSNDVTINGIQLVDALGKIVMQNQYATLNTKQKIEMQSFANGQYTLLVFTNKRFKPLSYNISKQ
jgi:hypothetical protein